MKKSIIATAIMTIAITIAGCSSTTTSSSPTISTSTSSPTISTSTSNGVVGFGATKSAWDAHHTADLRGNLNPGCCYNRDPNLKGGPSTDRYFGVTWSNGIVTGYGMSLLKGTKLKAAMAEALAEMPNDVKISFFHADHKSATLEATSAILKKVLGDPKIGSTNGAVDFVFCSDAIDGTSSHNPANINDIYVNFGMGLANAKDTTC